MSLLMQHNLRETYKEMEINIAIQSFVIFSVVILLKWLSLFFTPGMLSLLNTLSFNGYSFKLNQSNL